VCCCYHRLLLRLTHVLWPSFSSYVYVSIRKAHAAAAAVRRERAVRSKAAQQMADLRVRIRSDVAAALAECRDDASDVRSVRS
jgi:hypothetical protein